jgi:hypothetical protein
MHMREAILLSLQNNTVLSGEQARTENTTVIQDETKRSNPSPLRRCRGFGPQFCSVGLCASWQIHKTFRIG